MEDIKRDELVHKHPWMKDEEFFAEIDRTGGWPRVTRCMSRLASATQRAGHATPETGLLPAR